MNKILLTSGIFSFGIVFFQISKNIKKRRMLKKFRNIDLRGKVALITGASAGIGFEIAKEMAKRNSTVIFACRNEQKTLKVIKEIEKENKQAKGKLLFFHLDLNDLNSVRNCAKRVKEKFRSINFLFNNAGIGTTLPNCTKQKIEQMFGVNYLSHWLLTNLLMDLIKKGDCKVINTSSMAHIFGKKSYFQEKYIGDCKECKEIRYQRSKAANIAHAKTLARRIKKFKGAFFSFHPGIIKTKIFDEGKKSSVFTRLYMSIIFPFFSTPKQGSSTAIFLAFEDLQKLKNGGYYWNCKLARNLKFINEENFQNELWKKSEELCNQKFNFEEQ